MVNEADKKIEELEKQNQEYDEKNHGRGPMYLVIGLVIIVVIFALAGNSNNQQQNTAASNTFFVNGEVNVRKCAAITCDSYGKYSFNGGFDLAYKSMDDLPDWVEVNFKNTTTGENIDGYISKSLFSLNQNVADNSSSQASQQQVQPSNQTQTPPAQKSLADIVKEWRPRVGQVFCQWKYSNVEDSGSGFLMLDAGEPAVLTNYHLLNYQGAYPDSCSTWFYSNFNILSGILFLGDGSWATKATDGSDWGMFIPSKVSSTSEIKTIASKPFSVCSVNYPGDAAVGDNVAIIGYPAIGSKTDVTVTRGIISGTDGDYYVTDAKIDHGNSGGVAILLKDDCYLGIPSASVVGQIESLGRILSASAIFK